MSLLRSLSDGLRSLFRKERVEGELDEELRGFLEMAAEEKMKQGMSSKDALRTVGLERGNLEGTKEVVRTAGWESNGVLLQPLPYPHSEELVVVARTEPRFDHPVPVSGPNFLDWRVRAKEFQSLAGFDGRGFALMLDNEAEHILGAAVSYNFLQVLQVVPAFGRDFLKSEEHLGNDHVVLVSNGFWKQRLGGNPAAVGRKLILNGQSFTLVGVLPADFRYVLMQDAEIFIPLNLDETARGQNFMSVVGRLKPGVSLRQAQSEMDSIARLAE